MLAKQRRLARSDGVKTKAAGASGVGLILYGMGLPTAI